MFWILKSNASLLYAVGSNNRNRRVTVCKPWKRVRCAIRMSALTAEEAQPLWWMPLVCPSGSKCFRVSRRKIANFWRDSDSSIYFELALELPSGLALSSEDINFLRPPAGIPFEHSKESSSSRKNATFHPAESQTASANPQTTKESRQDGLQNRPEEQHFLIRRYGKQNHIWKRAARNKWGPDEVKI